MGKPQTVFAFAEAASCGPYDERPVLTDDLDIRLTLSRNDVPQPFYLICEHDTVLVAVSGRGRVDFEGSSVDRFDYVAGDVIYVPAGTPHRIVPSAESIHHRFKLPESELEGVAFHCEECGAELHREVFALAEELPQEGYQRACREFFSNEELRRCEACGAVHPARSLEGFRWAELAASLRADQGRVTAD